MAGFKVLVEPSFNSGPFPELYQKGSTGKNSFNFNSSTMYSYTSTKKVTYIYLSHSEITPLKEM